MKPQWFLMTCSCMFICDCRTDIPFAGITIIVAGDFLKLLPLKARPVYAECKSDWLNFAPFWELFKIAELTEFIRQRGDAEFIDLFNHIRVAELNNCDLEILRSKFISANSIN